MISKMEREINTASGIRKAGLVLKNAWIVNVFTEEIERADIAIEDGWIVGIGEYDGETERDLTGCYVCPGLIDGHIHLESSMIHPAQFERAVLPHGTTAVVTDPHEIANVAGTAGIDFMMKAAEELKLDVFFMLSSCVPATGLDESGAELKAEDLEPYYENPRVLGLAELMDFYGTVRADRDILEKAAAARQRGKLIDGHGPFLTGKELNAYVTAGVTSDHECSDIGEAMEKMRRGQWIMVREGTAAKNLTSLMALFQAPYCQRAMLVTDDRHPEDLIEGGHIDYIIKKAVGLGADPIKAIKMGSLHPAVYFGLKDRGAVAPGYRADLAVFSDLKEFRVRQVYKDGVLAAEDGSCLFKEADKAEEYEEPIKERVFHSFHMKPITEEDFKFDRTGDHIRVIRLKPGELGTEELILPYVEREGESGGVNLAGDVIKMAVFERHHNTGHRGLGFLGGYGLKKGAVASSISHDSHNLVIAGTNDRDMALAGNRVRGNGGGLAVVVDGAVIGDLPLPIAGLMSNWEASKVAERMRFLKEKLRDQGITGDIDPFMTLAFASLPVIPKLRLNTYGVIDADSQQVVDVFVT